MSYRLHSLSLPYFALSLAVIACGDDGTSSGSADTSNATPGTLGTEASTSSPTTVPTDPGDTDGTMSGGMSNSISSTVDPDTEPGPTTAGPTSNSDTDTDPGNTTETVCTPENMCGGDCCGGDELCDNGECVPDCGGPDPCGVEKICCADGEL